MRRDTQTGLLSAHLLGLRKRIAQTEQAVMGLIGGYEDDGRALANPTSELGMHAHARTYAHTHQPTTPQQQPQQPPAASFPNLQAAAAFRTAAAQQQQGSSSQVGNDK